MKKDKNGFIMIGIMLVTVSIWIMGLTLISISMSNAKLKIISRQSKQNFYICEGAIEGVKSKLMEEIQNAIESGWIEVDRFMEDEYDDFICSEMQKEIEGSDSLYIESSKDQYGHIDYRTDKDKIEEMLNEMFKSEYSRYFCGEKKRDFVNGIEAVEIDGARINVIDDMVVNEGDEIVFEISSSRKYKASDIRIDVEMGIVVPDSDCGHLDYSKSKASVPLIMDFDMISPNPVNVANAGDIAVLTGESEMQEVEGLIKWDKEMSSQCDGTVVYVGEEDFEMEEHMCRGVIITRGAIKAGNGCFEGMLIGLGGIECEDGFSLKRNRSIVETIMVLNSLEDIFDMSKSDSSDYIISVEKLGRAKIHGDVDVESFIDIRQWTRRR
ncbi:hypothetical protein SAMN02745945_00668 [Peptoclostridium litorale DSM 5388]|uniref:Uncharacterized protein n=1 Tax=Peptoclostridium litorale DSM 5388 TaxID=1121324 RepID=A0A069RB09_PEPLI|nr:hypothetical protein [Peptoclostridium litorale]KDR93988.1 hypothetical protein CLIT_23c02600 [Peptoclostridium litorale DSM 5388]SIN79152.1 hypothetical protein SAMN02745945_00668 [Peptoclostridium litorale DSM 5388]